jgi:fermentation-respiration switch protein FrsA (DUF1100 family)
MCVTFLYVVAQASAIRVVSTTLAMLPVDIFVNVNRIGTNNPLFTPVFPSSISRGGWGLEGKIEIPTMIIHGTDDEVVPYWHGTELYAKAGNPYKVPPPVQSLFSFLSLFLSYLTRSLDQS